MYIFLKKKFWLLLLLPLTSCHTYHPLNKYNYQNGGIFYNDSLEISFKYFGDINFRPLEEVREKEIKSRLRDIDFIRTKDLLAYGIANIDPVYDFSVYIQESTDEMDSLPTSLTFKDEASNRVLYKKSDGQQTTYFLLHARNPNNNLESITKDGETITESLEFSLHRKKELTYSKIFQAVRDSPNYLLARQKLKTAPIPGTNENEWMRFQFLATINSFISNNRAHDSLIQKFEHSRRKYLKPILDTLLLHSEIKTGADAIRIISRHSANTRVLMLNENHWYPKHRILGIKLLGSLKANGYTHLALEALSEDQVSSINARSFPLFNSGYYTREPYFAHFIRKAKELGFVVVGYENTDPDINRELGQAQNLAEILEKDSHVKLFVYAGLDHIVEEVHDGQKRMAAYFKEISNIDPLTVNQANVVGETENELVLIPSKLMTEDKRFDEAVDYFVINNIPARVESFSDKPLNLVTLEDEIFQEYRDQDLLVKVYNSEEYSTFKSRSIPLLSYIKEPSSDASFDIFLPSGDYSIEISSAEEGRFWRKRISSDKKQN